MERLPSFRSLHLRLLRSGKMERQRRVYSPQSPLNEEQQKKLLQWVGEQPDLTLLELQERLQRECNLRLSLRAIWPAEETRTAVFKKTLSSGTAARAGSKSTGSLPRKGKSDRPETTGFSR